jgi:hypothetical protein
LNEEKIPEECDNGNKFYRFLYRIVIVIYLSPPKNRLRNRLLVGSACLLESCLSLLHLGDMRLLNMLTLARQETPVDSLDESDGREHCTFFIYVLTESHFY